MTHLRIIHEDGKYFIEKRFSFLFWTHWEKIDRYGNEASPFAPISFKTYSQASDALDELVDRICHKNKAEVLKTVSI